MPRPRAAGEEVQHKLQVESSRKTIFLVLRLLRFSRAVAEKPQLIGHGSETCRKITFGYERDQLVQPVERSAALQLLDSFPDQLLKLLRLRGVSLRLVLSKTGLKCQSLLEILCLGDLFDQREN